MKLPRDLSGKQLVEVLATLGYHPTRQTGSHVRLTTQHNGEHHATVPMHASIKPGTLNGILRDVAEHRGLERSELLRLLFE